MDRTRRIVEGKRKNKKNNEIVKANSTDDILQALAWAGYFDDACDRFSQLIMFDFDGVVFPLGGSTAKNVDNKFLKLIRLLKKYAVVGGLTKRRGRAFVPAATCYLSRRTRKCLATFADKDVEFNLLPGVMEKFADDSVLFKGVFFIGVKASMSKGEAFEKLLGRIKAGDSYQQPAQVALVDDCYENLLSVSEVCKKNGLEFLGIHYIAPFESVVSVEMDSFFRGVEWGLKKTFRALKDVLLFANAR